MRSLTVTADDFGMAPEVNEGVEIAHRFGILTATSLMMGASATSDAVERAHRMPDLNVGLHIVLVEGRPVLPPGAVPDLIDGNGFFRNDMARAGIAMFMLPSVQRQLAAEIEAQFEAFAATGLRLDHVNAHKHFQLHPTIARHIIRIGRRYGLTTVRVPHEPSAQVRRIDPTTQASSTLWPFTAWLRTRLKKEGIQSADRVYGLSWSGAFCRRRMEALLRDLPPGHSEIYLHPAVTDDFRGSCRGYRYRGDLDALTATSTMDAYRVALGRCAETIE